MMIEQEKWDMQGVAAIERVNSHPSVWNEFLDVLGILNMEVHKEFADHLMGLQKDLIDILFEICCSYTKTAKRWWDILRQLSHPPAQALEPYSVAYFSNPGSYNYYIKGSDETFRSYKADHQKAYREYMENKLCEHFQRLFECYI